MLSKLFIVLLLYILHTELKTWSYETFVIDINSIRVKNKLLHQYHQKLKMLELDWTVYNLVLISIVLILAGYMLTHRFCKLPIPSTVTGLMMGFIPFAVLDYKVAQLNNVLSLEVSKLVSMLSRWAVVKEDIYYCFEKVTPNLTGILKQYVEEFMLQVRYSGHSDYAFDIIIENTHHEMLRNVMINLQQANRSKGDLVGLLERLEEECFMIFGENEDRKAATHFDRYAIHFSIVGVMVITIIIFAANPPLRNFYLETKLGNYLISIFSVLFFFGVYAASKISVFNY